MKKKKGPGSEDREITQRVIAVRKAFAKSQMGMGDKLLFVDRSRWNNFERGYPLSLAVAKILHAHYGISLDWLYFGETGNMSPPLLQMLQKLKGR